MALKDVLREPSSNLSNQFFQPQTGVKTPGSNIVALALVARNTLADLGGQYTPPGGSATTVTAANIVGFIKNLCFLDQAVFFGNGQLSGKKGKPNENKSSEKFGTYTLDKPTGDVVEKLDIMFSKMFLNVPFFNNLRANATPYDVYFFTQTSVQILRYDQDEIVFDGVGYEIAGDITKEIAGGFTVNWSREGDLVPNFGVKESDLSSESMKYSFGAYTASSGVAPVVNTPDRFTLASATAGAFTRAVNEGGTVGYQLFRNTKDAITTEPVTIDTLTGKVTIAATLAAGRYVFTVVAVNQTGVYGTYSFIIDKAAA